MRTSKYDPQALMCLRICTHHRLHCDNEKKSHISWYMHNNSQNMVIQPPQAHNQRKNKNNGKDWKIDTSGLMMKVRWFTNISSQPLNIWTGLINTYRPLHFKDKECTFLSRQIINWYFQFDDESQMIYKCILLTTQNFNGADQHIPPLIFQI